MKLEIEGSSAEIIALLDKLCDAECIDKEADLVSIKPVELILADFQKKATR